MRGYVFLSVVMTMLPLAAIQPFVGVLLWSWISFMNPHREVWGFATNQPWALLVFGATIIGCLLAREPKRFEWNAATITLVVMMGVFTLTSLFTLAPAAATWDKWDRTFKIVLGVLLTASLLTSRRRIHALIWVMCISLGYYGVKGGIFAIMTAGSYRTWGPPDSIIGDNNHIATALLVAVPLMNYLRLQSKHRIVRLLILAAMTLTTLAALASYSRGAMIAAAAAALLLWWRSNGKIISGMLIAGCLAAGVNFMPPQWVDRMNSITTYEEDASATTRLKLWEVSFKFAVARPLAGAGFRGPYSREAVDTVMPGGPARAVHSIWFEVMGEHGFLGFAVWFMLLPIGVYHAMRLKRLTRDRPDLAWAADLGRMVPVSILAYAAGGTFLSLAYWDFFWTIIVITAATHALVVKEVRGTAPVAATAPVAWRRRPAAGNALARVR